MKIALTDDHTVDISSTDAIAFAIFVVLVAALFALSRKLFSKAFEERETYIRRLATSLKGPGQALLFLLALYLLSENLTFDWAHGPQVDTLFTLAAIWLVAWIAIRAVRLLPLWVLKRRGADVQSSVDARVILTQVRVLQHAATALIVLVAIALALMSFSAIRTLGTSLLASAGVAGIIVGVAAQRTLGNFFIGLQLAITQPVRIGDSVITEGDFGTVEEINLTYVVVKTWDQRRLILPVSYFLEKPFQNWTLERNNDLLTTVFFWVDFQMPLQPIRDEFHRLLAGTDLWNGKVEAVHVTDSNDKAMQIRLLASAADAGKNYELQTYLRSGILSFIQSKYPHCLPHSRTQTSVFLPHGVPVMPLPGHGMGQDSSQSS